MWTPQEPQHPGLLDRLSDHARYKEQFLLRIKDAGLDQAGVSRAQLLRALEVHGIMPAADRARRADAITEPAGCQWFETLAGALALNRAMEAVVTGSADEARVSVADLVEVVQRRSAPNLQESRQDRVLSAKQLRGYVLRDLGWLLNTGSLATLVDLSAHPRTKDSVLNYGIPDVAGSIESEADVGAIAAAIEEAIAAFEPRLQRVRVVAAPADSEKPMNALRFLIEATLWARPTPEQLFLRTELDLESADVRVSESAVA
ncbi:MAG: type VI secretion system baseplate subunit TssE [Salinisphaera sp.]|nr:type VI secretion system baseplate subunit TssE [Salinisphaera sp.]